MVFKKKSATHDDMGMEVVQEYAPSKGSYVTVALVIIGLLVNLYVLSIVSSLKSVDVARMWGAENYKLFQEVIATDGFKQMNKMQLDGMLKQFDQPAVTAPTEWANPIMPAPELGTGN